LPPISIAQYRWPLAETALATAWPHSPCTGLGLASHRNVLGNGSRRPTTRHKTSVIETIAARHIIGVLLSKGVQ
jgi:hypothetical protein